MEPLTGNKASLRQRLDRGPRDLRRRLPVRAGTSRLPAGRRIRSRSRARASGGGDPAAPGLRARRVGRGRGAHLLCAPREAADHRPRAGPGADQPAGARHCQGRRAGNRRPVRRRHLQHQRLRSRRPRVAQGRARDVRGAGRLGGRRRRRLHHRRDILLRAGSADRARRHQAREADGGDHARHAPGRCNARELERRSTRASASPTRAPMWSASIASAARRR